MTAELLPYFFPGDIIISGSGTKYKYIRQMSKVNYLCEGEDGQQYRVRISPRVVKAPEGTEWNAPEKPPVEVFVVGEPITMIGDAGAKHGTTTKYVVIRAGSEDRYSVAKYGGNGGRYVRGLHASHMKRVEE